MKLSELLNGIRYNFISGEDIEVSDIAYDSRNVVDNCLFVCITGFNTDGHKFIPQAIKNGAVAIVCEKEITAADGITVVQVFNSRTALACISANFYYHPSNNMNVIGITGTNGKTSTAFFIESIFNEALKKSGIIGTIHNKIGNKVLHSDKTTPESLELQHLLSDMRDENVENVIMEVSSHSLILHRVDFMNFDIGIFTNLTQDHLDFHKSMNEYLFAKSLLFSKCKYGVINIDDPAHRYIIENSSCSITTFGIDNPADFKAYDITIFPQGVTFNVTIDGVVEHFEMSTPGKFTVYNALAAIATAYLVGIDIKCIREGLKNNCGVPGRFQTIQCNNRGYSVIVDYAHTPDGLSKLLKTVKEFAKGDIITVFGCGGDRDKTKRPLMGEIAGLLSKTCIITSDNPRSEEPMEIIYDIEVGIEKTDCFYTIIEDRKEAIIHALDIAEKDDVIVIAGKGHENYQILKNKTIDFDDVNVVKDKIKFLDSV